MDILEKIKKNHGIAVSLCFSFTFLRVSNKSLKNGARTITIVHRLVSDASDRNIKTIIPPPSTVSIVLASRFGVNASKSLIYQEERSTVNPQNKTEPGDDNFE